ncbi:hypothetical protein Patl1_14093 [Pistacia atlantica]|uniref:Uncharacterized protein n=1 Tax=Pistacia atlantica TaxID=434234 RepID=A0ACC1ATQ9_9ROSI|nr:hypothetical protein Patl1_14093 [Pistacia atlantica]
MKKFANNQLKVNILNITTLAETFFPFGTLVDINFTDFNILIRKHCN